MTTNPGPLFRKANALTDIFGGALTAQHNPMCRDFELDLVDCLEAYGLHRGVNECRTYREDLYECTMKIKQFRRMYLMNAERKRQVDIGKRTEMYDGPMPNIEMYETRQFFPF